jgi:hypothetical protein
MVDRQDIDALLVSALYGELTPADEARLSQHLESHPTDRTVLDDLTRARAAVRDSRIFELQLEPPQAISALLLQEAARRAPRKIVDESKPSWFARLVNSFIAHPAMAAAASLVLVVGVAGTMYLRHGDSQIAERTVTTQKQDEGGVATVTATERAVPPTAAPAAPAAQPPMEIAEGADGDGTRKELAKGTASTGQGSAAYGVRLDDNSVTANRRMTDPKAEPKPRLERQRQVDKPRDGLIVNGTVRQPKDLGENEAKQAARNDASGDMVAAGPGGGGGAMAPSTPTTGFADAKAQAPAHAAAKPDNKLADTRPAQPVTPAPAPPPPPPAAARTADDKNAEAKKEVDDLEKWARGELGKARAYAKSAKCPDAAKTALGISIRAPEFYAQNVADDRDLKSCRSYIEAEREKDSERRAKSRPAKKASPAEADMKANQ